MKRKKQGCNNRLLPYETIRRATNGDAIAMDDVLRFYQPYISTLTRRECIADDGTVSIGCDYELKARLEAKLMAKILLFNAEEK